MTIDDLLIPEEAARIIGISKIRIYQLARQGRIPFFKRGKRIILFEKKEVEKFKKIPRINGRPLGKKSNKAQISAKKKPKK